MKLKLTALMLVILFSGCNQKEEKTGIEKTKAHENFQQGASDSAGTAELNEKTGAEKTKARKYFEKGTIDSDSKAELKLLKISSDNLSDASVNSLRAENYFADQFSCVVHGYSYYRLTNMHSSKEITGCVTKSWLYEGRTVYEHVPFTLKPGGWQLFGCFFVTASQPITFKICSFFGKEQKCACPN
ncbi:hypothetical protein [Flavobacterium sp. DG2-3]|uniref:hypothetical protein n=1 Tax=Flavobacterium sp. DG2-3 TaxID=3068317 RepID=UPI00273DC5B7|nr:hypothetical protein [Flavobacterium sp. DG2-3]MDP5199807.1 hypothetical protein [Flavobacterium sp. DG2-3]